MLLFHGSKANFKHFDKKFIGTGEVNHELAGFYFATSYRGAALHAINRLHNNSGIPLVYVCKLKNAETINLQLTIAISGSKKIMAHWIHNLPVSISTLIDSENWYQRLKQELSYTLINSNMVSDTVALSYLEENGIDAIYDYEYGPWCDGYGSSVLVLNSKIIEILEIVPAHCLIEYEKYEKYENG